MALFGHWVAVLSLCGLVAGVSFQAATSPTQGNAKQMCQSVSNADGNLSNFQIIDLFGTYLNSLTEYLSNDMLNYLMSYADTNRDGYLTISECEKLILYIPTALKSLK